MGLASSRCRSWRKVKTEAWREVNKECWAAVPAAALFLLSAGWAGADLGYRRKTGPRAVLAGHVKFGFTAGS